MGGFRAHRLHIRRLELAAACGGFAAAAALPAGVLTGDAGRVLATFLGLVAASILPTISLIVGGLTPGGRSVKHLKDLADELQRTISALFAIFGMVAAAVATLVLLTIPNPLIELLPMGQSIPTRLAQGVIGALAVLTVAKSGTVPGAIRKSLQIRADLAVQDARRRLGEKAITAAPPAAFATREGFGRVRSVEDLSRPESDPPKN